MSINTQELDGLTIREIVCLEDKNKAVSLIESAIQEARKERVGDAIIIDTDPEVMRFVLSKIRLKDRTIARRVLVSEWGINNWRKNGGDAYIWQLKILASLTGRYNWTVFLLKPENLPARRSLTNPDTKAGNDGKV